MAMKNPLVVLARTVSEASGKSGVSPAFIPLKDIHEAVVFVDASKPGYNELVKAVKSFFSDNRIALRLYAMDINNMAACSEKDGVKLITKPGVHWYGTVKGFLPAGENLFIDLTEGDIYATRNAAIRSVAPLKVSRMSVPHTEINMEICKSAGYTQMQVFDTVCHLLKSIN